MIYCIFLQKLANVILDPWSGMPGLNVPVMRFITIIGQLTYKLQTVYKDGYGIS